MMSPSPKSPEEKKLPNDENSSNDELSHPPNHTQHEYIASDESATNSDDDNNTNNQYENFNGYCLLPQESDINNQQQQKYDDSENEDEEFLRFATLRSQSSMDENKNFPTINSTTFTNESIWTTKLESESFPVDDDTANYIKNLMSSIKLPESSIPIWAQYCTEQDWQEKLQQQNFDYPSRQYEQHSYWQPLNSEQENNQLTILEKSEQPQEEQQKHKQSLTNFISIHRPNFDLSDVPEENSSLSSTYSLTDTTVENNNNDNQSYLFTSTPIVPSFTSNSPITNNKIFATLLSDQNNNNTPLPLLSDSGIDQSSTISRVGLTTDIQRKADVCQLNNMSALSSLRYSSNLGTGTIKSHPYDQRISDQGDKYIIQLKTDEYQENEFTVTPRYSFNQLIIDGKHREEDSLGGYIHRELHKIFNIPKHIDLNRYTYSYDKHTQELIIEMPYIQTLSASKENQNDSSFISPIRNTTESLTYLHGNVNRNSGGNMSPTVANRSNYHYDSNNTSGIGTVASDTTLMRSSNTAVAPIYESSIGNTTPFDFDLFHRSAFRPQIVQATSDDANNDKKLMMSLDLSDYQAEDIKVSVKDHELIVKAERKIETDTRKSRTSFFQSTSLPPQTDIENLQSNYIDGKLVIEAPYIDHNRSERRIINTSSSSSDTNQGMNWQTVTESQEKTTDDDPFQRRTETVTEFVRVRRL
ncbi:unnamed protein product [Rotaria sp. Silwood1]|nr:unnamed protein product [Rotaria sp. Silwood1]CAF1238589.1 unnamed protein product [Rotaria sp. Silwood1]CAF3497985.1 unnamed protein product [Rotaria sp. Silwood1]CAF3501464.1 unnamed protein product [Rotaria sp. Silwood1]CAF4654058.1 unnamed protein product [Rotaria sp. Silwood1]